jgi:hypothetical protein
MKVLLENIFAGRLGLTCDQPAEDINDIRESKSISNFQILFVLVTVGKSINNERHNETNALLEHKHPKTNENGRRCNVDRDVPVLMRS